MVKVGKVNENEKKEILILFERKKALEELKMSFNNTDLFESDFKRLKEKYDNILPKVTENFDNWWLNMANKYNWNREEGKVWNIDFETNDIYLDFI